MLFNSYIFVFLFLPLALGLHWIARRLFGHGAAVGSIIGVSLLFYAWWKVAYLALLLLSIAVNYLLCRTIGRRSQNRKAWLIVGIAFNLGLLAYFKYAAFALITLNAVAGSVLVEPWAIVLPLAISFYTFQQIAFLVDTYRGEIPVPSLAHYSAAVTFFPHLIAGPIVQYRDLLPQVESMGRRAIPANEFAMGIALFAAGLFKKLVIADHVGAIADRAFDPAALGSMSALDAWQGALAYTGQLYFDFSAYSDMALGLAHMFGITLPMNFNSPYQAKSIIDFWRRWHITLSEFLRKYLYFPLGGNRGGPAKRYRNLMITMLLGGLWHGAGWQFVLWGGLHGLGLVANHWWRSLEWKLPGVVCWALTFLFVVLAWVPFRSPDISHALEMYRLMFSPESCWDRQMFGFRSLAEITGVLACACLLPNAVSIVRGHAWADAIRFPRALAAAVLTVFLAGVFSLGAPSQFLYFNF